MTDYLLIGSGFFLIGTFAGFLLSAMLTIGKFNDLENEIIALENEIDSFRGVL